jgi:XTP/dITP diphosphohydrolase
MKKILIATHNKAKEEYFKKLLNEFNLDFISLAGLNIKEDAPEEEADEVGNALSKARFYMEKSREISLADDAGMYMDALGGKPGVQVRRWMGKFPDNISDKDWLDFFLKKMKGIPREKRSGKFKITRAIVTPGGEEFIIKWVREFFVAEEPNWDNYQKGWPMSTLYIEKGIGRSWVGMSWEERLKLEKNNLIEFKKIFNKIYK